MIEIALVGTGGMQPLPHRHLTSMLARKNGSMLLIDCGEGTQVSLQQLGWGFKNIDYIAFTHFHADHMVGFPGLLHAIANAGREEGITVFGPKGIQRIAENLCVIARDLPFMVKYREMEQEETVILPEFTLSSLFLKHRVPCLGYKIYVPRSGKFYEEKAKELDIPVKYWNVLQRGKEIGGYEPEMVLGPVRKGITVCYITDTRPTDKIPDFIRESDLFICEGLHGEEDKKEKAASYMHMIYSEAAELAKKGNVKELWLTHFSPAMTDPKEHLQNAAGIFSNTIAGSDRMIKQILFERDDKI